MSRIPRISQVKVARLPELAFCDLLIVLSTCPTAFYRAEHAFLENLRRIFPSKPIVLYDCQYLPTRGRRFFRSIKSDDAQNFGMERFDWYLTMSVTTRIPLPPIEHPVSVIGINLQDPSLFPAPKERFIALLDFERPAQMRERATMIQALQETGVEYRVLNGHYSQDAIRAIYRETSVYFVAFFEAFGIPVCELQACGAYVFTPYSHWVVAHGMKDPTAAGEGLLSDNFIVYGNDLALLKERLRAVRATYDPQRVFERFVHFYPQFYYGNLDELQTFISNIRSGVITARSHSTYLWMNDSIPEDA